MYLVFSSVLKLIRYLTKRPVSVSTVREEMKLMMTVILVWPPQWILALCLRNTVEKFDSFGGYFPRVAQLEEQELLTL